MGKFVIRNSGGEVVGSASSLEEARKEVIRLQQRDSSAKVLTVKEEGGRAHETWRDTSLGYTAKIAGNTYDGGISGTTRRHLVDWGKGKKS